MTDARPTNTRVVIADDEPLGRQRLRMLLAEERWIEVVEECADGAAAITAIVKFRPGLVFLDVHMPGGSGFDVIDAIGVDRMPFVIFVTAFDRYALRAFDVHALDYLLKPFDRDRFRDALARAREQIDGRSGGDLERRLRALVNDLKPGPQPLQRFVIRSAGRVFFVRANEIEWIEAAGTCVKLHVGPETHLVRETMNALEAKLDPTLFFRIHHSHIVNIERVRELQPCLNGEFVVFLMSGARLTLSRGYRDKLQDRIGRAL
jgi:two-component system LytT family response regulator